MFLSGAARTPQSDPFSPVWRSTPFAAIGAARGVVRRSSVPSPFTACIALLATIASVITLLLFVHTTFPLTIVVPVQPIFAICAVIIGQWVTGTELDISSMIGMTMIVGIGTELAILHFSALADIQAQTAGGEMRAPRRSSLRAPGSTACARY